jgi:hypothetical protein
MMKTRLKDRLSLTPRVLQAPTKKPRRVLHEITPQIRNESRRLWVEKEKEVEKERRLQEQRVAEEKQRLETSRLEEGTSFPHRIETQASTCQLKGFCQVFQRNVELLNHGQLHLVCNVGLQHGEVLLSRWLQ